LCSDLCTFVAVAYKSGNLEVWVGVGYDVECVATNVACGTSAMDS
jgi:hypothetical protein